MTNKYLPHDDGMTKLGVSTPGTRDDGSKTAASQSECDLCGRSLEKIGSVVRCPVHGTAPFEG